MIEDDKRIRKFIIVSLRKKKLEIFVIIYYIKNYFHYSQAQIRPWRLCDIEYMPNPDSPLDPRLTVFLGGLPRPTKAGKFHISFFSDLFIE